MAKTKKSIPRQTAAERERDTQLEPLRDLSVLAREAADNAHGFAATDETFRLAANACLHEVLDAVRRIRANLNVLPGRYASGYAVASDAVREQLRGTHVLVFAGDGSGRPAELLFESHYCEESEKIFDAVDRIVMNRDTELTNKFVKPRHTAPASPEGAVEGDARHDD